jgi:hypothetical protein
MGQFPYLWVVLSLRGVNAGGVPLGAEIAPNRAECRDFQAMKRVERGAGAAVGLTGSL